MIDIHEGFIFFQYLYSYYLLKKTMMKNYVLLLFLVVSFSCNKHNQPDKILQDKNKTIDSLKTELEDCKGQAKIMADILEKERIELQNKKTTD